ncbi:MAG TPA: glycosyltransferase family 87 protein [Terriglobales bacterium]|nr:glycosyltransferase family 87 protein [Terriglobales bacterium]
MGSGGRLYDLEVQRTLMDAAISPYHRGKLMPFIYPAYVAQVLRPLGYLPFRTAFLIWVALNLAIAVWLATRLSRWFAPSPLQRLAVCVTFFAWMPLQLTLFHGQLGILATLAIVQALLALRSGHEWRAGWWLSAGLMKPQLILFPVLVFLIWRRWRTVLAFVIALMGFLGISIAGMGLWFAAYLRFLVEYNRGGAALSLYPEAMQNWRGLVWSLFKTENGAASWAVLLALTVISMLLVVVVCYPRSASHRQASFLPGLAWDARYAIAILFGLLSSPHLYMHDWVVAMPAGLVLWCFASQQLSSAGSAMKIRNRALLWLLAAAPVIFFAMQLVGQFAAWPIQPVPLYMGTLAVVAVASVGPDFGASMASDPSPPPVG